MRRLALALALLGALLLATAGAAAAQAATVTTVERLPLSLGTAGCGEALLLSGSLHQVTHVTFDAAGGVRVAGESNTQGLRGLGLTSGATYRGTSVARYSSTASGPAPRQETVVLVFTLIGRGPADNLLVQGTFHLTVNASGAVTTVVEGLRVRCQG